MKKMERMTWKQYDHELGARAFNLDSKSRSAIDYLFNFRKLMSLRRQIFLTCETELIISTCIIE